MSDHARLIYSAVIELALRHGLMTRLNELVQPGRLLAFEQAAEVAIDRLLEVHAEAHTRLHAEALANAREDVSHLMAERERLIAERHAIQKHHATQIAELAERRLAFDDDGV